MAEMIMIRSVALYWVCVVSVFPSPVFGLMAQPLEPPSGPAAVLEIVRGEYTYNLADETMEIAADERGEPTVTYGAQSITARTIHYDQKTNELTAVGNVRLWDQGTILRGNHLVFNLETGEGVLSGLDWVEISTGVYVSGEKLELRHRAGKIPKGATEPERIREYILRDGKATTNDLPVPFYYLKYDKLVLVPNTRITLQDMVLVSQSIPWLYFPFYTRSLAEHKVAYFINANYYSDLGFAVFNRVLFSLYEEWKLDLYGDYYTRAGLGKGAKFRFDVPGPYGPKGYVYGYHLDQEAPDNDSIYDGDERWLLAGEYGQDLPYDMRLSARGHRYSDSEYRWDYRRPSRQHDIFLDDLDQDAVSFINLAKWWDDQSLRITAASRLDSFYYNSLPYVERTPQIHLEQYPYNLFGTGLFADLQLDYGRFRREEGATFPLNKYDLYERTFYYDEVDRLDSELRLEYPLHLPNRFTVKPWVGFRGTQYEDPSRSVGDPITTYDFGSETRAMGEGGVEVSNRLTYEFDPFLDEFQRMRAVVEPVLAYGYYHPSTDLEEILTGPDVRFPYIDPVDEFRYKMHRTSALVRTRIQGKNRAGLNRDWMRFSSGLVYDIMPDDNLRFDNFVFYDDPANHHGYRFSDLVENFTIYPLDWLSFGNELRYDVDDGEMRASHYFTNLTPIDPVHVSLGYLTYRHPSLHAEEQQDLTFHLGWDLSQKWQMYYSLWFDLDDSTFRRNEIGLLRDMYDFYSMFQIEHRTHPTLGDDFSVSVGFYFWGIGGRKDRSMPARHF